MTFEKFKELAKEYNLIPVYEVMTADLLTPVTAYLRVRKISQMSFLLESVEGSANMSRFSFIGRNPEIIISNKGLRLERKQNSEITKMNRSVFDQVTDELKKFKSPQLPGLPSFSGGVVGFIGYENISLIEPVIKFGYEPSGNPDSILGLYKEVLAFDHLKHQILLINNVHVNNQTDLKSAFNSAKESISELKNELKANLNYSSDFRMINPVITDFDFNGFYDAVEKSKKNIFEGDIFQIVLSKRFLTEFSGDPFNLYRALRIINPSPYMYFLQFENNFNIIGTSPEDLLKIKNRNAQLLPIAGTRRRGNTEAEDLNLEKNLINDPKEIAEHTMLVDLGRNDLGRVCKSGTVKVTEKMKIQRYSHVMHLVSKIEGILSEEKNSIDALKACFPAGTVTGAPKIKAIQLISEYEKQERNVYAGSVGYFDFSGNLDMCIAIRTLFSKGKTIYWQSGAGIVADSIPELESKEIKNKSAVMVNALKFAEVIDEDFADR
jgi:anthranilate synthase component 1